MVPRNSKDPKILIKSFKRSWQEFQEFSYWDIIDVYTFFVIRETIVARIAKRHLSQELLVHG